MHIPEAMLQGSVCPVTAALTTLGLSTAAYVAWKAKDKPAATSFAAVTALIFAGQMLNFPVQFGTSGHPIGATLAVALLGSSFGILSMALVVAAQCLVFADGGVNALGANLLNMALLAALPAVVVRELFAGKSQKVRNTAYCAAAWCSVMLAAAACSLELAFASAVPFAKVLPAMLSVHALIALGETGLTLLACYCFASGLATAENRRAWLAPFAVALIAAMTLSPFASSSPDGLECVAKTLGFLHANAPLFASPFADYTIPTVSSEMLSTSLAGLLGIALLFPISYGIAATLRRRYEG